jgi:hypothetical protein
MFSGSYDKTVRVWDVTTLKCLATLQGAAASLCSAHVVALCCQRHCRYLFLFAEYAIVSQHLIFEVGVQQSSLVNTLQVTAALSVRCQPAPRRCSRARTTPPSRCTALAVVSNVSLLTAAAQCDMVPRK